MTDEEIDALTLKVYRARLDWECAGNADKQLAKDLEKFPNDNGAKQFGRSQSYRAVVTETLVQAGFHVRPVRPPPVRKATP